MRRLCGGAVLLLLSCPGCIRYGGPSDLRRELSREAGVKLDPGFAITVTRSGFALARMLTDGEEIPLKGVRRAEVGVYRIEGLRAGVEEPRPLALPEIRGLTPVVRVHEDGEQTFVLVGQGAADEITQLVVIVTEREEWVLVRIRGKLSGVVEQALAAAFDRADRPERTEAVLAAYRQAEAEPRN